jgi:hypothetical protein
MIRLNAQLMRHYFIEGNTERYLSDPCILTHLENPDFADGTEGWNLRPAEPGSIDARTAPLFGQLQGRAVTYYHAPAPEDLGDTVLWTKRSAEAPNRFSQIIRDLEPGRTYSLRWFTGDYQDLVQGRSDDTPHAVSVTIEKAEMLDDPELSYDYTLPSIPGWSGRKLGPFDRDNSYYYSGYHRVFRAEGTTARLTFSDWADPDTPGGPEGRELIWNFICVRPYLEPEQ